MVLFQEVSLLCNEEYTTLCTSNIIPLWCDYYAVGVKGKHVAGFSGISWPVFKGEYISDSMLGESYHSAKFCSYSETGGVTI